MQMEECRQPGDVGCSQQCQGHGHLSHRTGAGLLSSHISQLGGDQPEGKAVLCMWTWQLRLYLHTDGSTGSSGSITAIPQPPMSQQLPTTPGSSWRVQSSGMLSTAALQVRGGLSALPLLGLCDSNVDALQPLLRALLILGLEDVALAVGEDLEGPGQAAVPALLGHHFDTLHLAELNGAVVRVIFLKHRVGRINRTKVTCWGFHQKGSSHSLCWFGKQERYFVPESGMQRKPQRFSMGNGEHGTAQSCCGLKTESSTSVKPQRHCKSGDGMQGAAEMAAKSHRSFLWEICELTKQTRAAVSR